MLRNADGLRRFQLHARDGDIGHVHDLLFDDSHWQVRYVVVDASRWLPGRKVLLIPNVLGPPHSADKRIPTALPRDQVRHSPDIDTDKPVSRQREMDLFEYYGWSSHWDGGHGGFTQPVMADVSAEQQELAGVAPPGDPHLRSMRAVEGYAIEAQDGPIGHVEDFVVEDTDWTVRCLVVDTRHWLRGRKVVVPPLWVERIHWKNRSVAVQLSRDQVKNSPPYHPEQPVGPEYEASLHRHYGRP